MVNFPFGYQPIEPSTWAYLSSLLMLALFFKFNRFWSFRNFDLLLLILMAPGLLMVHYGIAQQHELEDDERAAAVSLLENSPPALAKWSGALLQETGNEAVSEEAADLVAPRRELTRFQRLQRWGYIWLFGTGLLWLVRLFYDPLLLRKPMLLPNLTVGGLVFLTCSLLIFLFANVLTSEPENLSGPRGAVRLFQRTATEAGADLREYGPGYPLLHLIPSIRMFVEPDPAIDDQPDQLLESRQAQTGFVDVARLMAILSQIAIVAGLIFVGTRHFGSFQMGVGMAAIFLMLPYTAMFGGDSMHLLPGALLIWAVALYPTPFWAGILIGTAAGVCYYPLFLLPLWISFYWERGRVRFTLGAVISILLVVSSLVFTSADFAGFLAQLKSIFGFMIPRQEGLGGIWALNWESWFRLPLLVGFIVLCISYAFWPVKKDLATLISCTAAAMVAVQYWHGDGGGLYVAWYLPLLLLVIFRPNLDDKTAVLVLKDRRRNPGADDLDFAA